jgi:FKBP-type peptidyl-prolyl cis-trans isomerase 2
VGMRIAAEALAGGDDADGNGNDEGRDDDGGDHEGGHGHSHGRAPLFYTVTDIAQGKVVLDGNHPLAGIALKFVATVVDVRPATQAEIDNGAADDPSSVVLRALP